MDTLPNELLLEIIDQVLLEGIRELVNISLVNRRLHHFAKQRAYSTYSLTHGEPALFIRTLASWPIRERCVKELDWDCGRSQNYTLVTDDSFLLPTNLTPTEFRNIRRGIGFEESLDIESDSGEILDVADLNDKLSKMGADVYLSLLLSLTPRVHTIRIAIPSVWDCHLVWLKSAWRYPALFNLNKVTIIGPMRIQNIVPLFLLPCLRSLILDHVAHDRNRILRSKDFEWHEHNATMEQLRKKRSGIESFHVTKYSIDTERIAELIGLCRRLEVLEFEYRGDYQLANVAEVEALLEAISNHSSSLTSLSLKDFRLTADRIELKKVSELEHINFLLLDITMVFTSPLTSVVTMLLSEIFQQLPKRLQHLQLVANDPDGDELAPSIPFCEALRVLGPTVTTILPTLHTLEIVGWDPLLGTFTCQTQVPAIQQAFAETGVRFQSQPLTLLPEEDDRWDLVTGECEEEDWLLIYWRDCHGYWTTRRDMYFYI